MWLASALSNHLSASEAAAGTNASWFRRRCAARDCARRCATAGRQCDRHYDVFRLRVNLVRATETADVVHQRQIGQYGLVAAVIRTRVFAYVWHQPIVAQRKPEAPSQPLGGKRFRQRAFLPRRMWPESAAGASRRRNRTASRRSTRAWSTYDWGRAWAQDTRQYAAVLVSHQWSRLRTGE